MTLLFISILSVISHYLLNIVNVNMYHCVYVCLCIIVYMCLCIIVSRPHIKFLDDFTQKQKTTSPKK